jgi:tRNA-2-methylthio-N6-dimethylallyladenosine synthase
MMMKKRVHIKSFGCQMNKLDTALVRSALEEANFVLTDELSEAHIVLINTCSVRQHAEERVFSHLGHLKHIKKSRPHLVVGVIGCMAQRLGDKLLEHDVVDLVCGPAQIAHIVKLCQETLVQERKRLDVTERIRQQNPDDADLEAFESVHDSDDKRIPGQAFVRVMRGCNNFCTYCIVPYVRGPEISRPPQAIAEQVRKLSHAGVKQITLLGQTVNAYQYEAGEKTYCLADLFELISGIPGIEWIRFVTNYPFVKNFKPIMQAMADLPQVCRYLHMPAQSGSDHILKAMNRHYTAQDYLDLLAQAREIVAGISIAGDFIVGFPDETDADFQETVEFVKQAQYKNCFVFKYSPRPGTRSDKRLADNISPAVKQQRNVDLLAVQEQISDQLSRQFMGQRVRILVEGLSKKPHLNAAQNNNNPQLVGRTDTDWIVVFNGPPSTAGEFAHVTIDKVSPLTLFGSLD